MFNISMVPIPSRQTMVMKVTHPRPFSTFYYEAGARESRWCAKGRACTVQGAAVASLRRIIDRRCASAIIHDIDGVVVARIMRKRNGIVCIGV